MGQPPVEAKQLIQGDGGFVCHGSALDERGDDTGKDLDGAVNPHGNAAVGVEGLVVLRRWREIDDRNRQAMGGNSDGNDLGDAVRHGAMLSVLPA